MIKQKQSTFRRFFGSRLFLISAFICFMLITFGYGRAYYQDYKVKEEIQALQNDVKKLEHKKLESMEILKYVTSDAFVEEKARTELNMKKPGENVVVIKNQVEVENKGEKGDVENRVLNNPTKWWYYFTNRDIN